VGKSEPQVLYPLEQYKFFAYEFLIYKIDPVFNKRKSVISYT
jgi:hypothetical protein